MLENAMVPLLVIMAKNAAHMIYGMSLMESVENYLDKITIHSLVENDNSPYIRVKEIN